MDDSELRQRVASAPVARLATVRANGAPHVVPVCFAVDGDRIVSVVDHKPKATTSLRRFDNVRAHPAVSLLVDHYDDDWARLWWVRVDGTAVVRDEGAEHDSAIELLAAKYRQYREVRPAGSVLEITASRWLGWSAA
jgi:PPOX class probable F420-dependent enzyme